MTQDEIGDLGRHFNNMVLTIKDLIDYKYKLELRQRESELTMLQRQMDPHFLYNTLDMVRWTARMEKAPNTSRLIETLSKFLRTSLSRTKRWSTLRHEFEFVRAYLELQQMRLGTKLTYNVEFEANLEDVPLLNKVVQPLVENSIKHGFSVKTGGHIDVRAYRDRHTVVIEVRDSGRGFTAEAKARLREALLQGDADEELKGHAICNIHERILIAAGEGYGVELVDEAGGRSMRAARYAAAACDRTRRERQEV